MLAPPVVRRGTPHGRHQSVGGTNSPYRALRSMGSIQSLGTTGSPHTRNTSLGQVAPAPVLVASTATLPWTSTSSLNEPSSTSLPSSVLSEESADTVVPILDDAEISAKLAAANPIRRFTRSSDVSLPMSRVLLIFRNEYYEHRFRTFVRHYDSTAFAPSAGTLLTLTLARIAVEASDMEPDSSEAGVRLTMLGVTGVLLTLGMLLRPLVRHPYQHHQQSRIAVLAALIGLSWVLGLTLFGDILNKLPQTMSFIMFEAVLINGTKVLLFPYTTIVGALITVAFVVISGVVHAPIVDTRQVIFNTFILMLMLMWLSFYSYRSTYQSRLSFIAHLKTELLAQEKAEIDRDTKNLKGEFFTMTLERFDIADIDSSNSSSDGIVKSPMEQAMVKLQTIGKNSSLPSPILKEVMAVISLLGSSSDIFRADVRQQQAVLNSGGDEEMTRYIFETLNGNFNVSGNNTDTLTHTHAAPDPGSDHERNSSTSVSIDPTTIIQRHANHSQDENHAVIHARHSSSYTSSPAAALINREDRGLSTLLNHLDCWNFDMFELSSLTLGKPLFFIGMALLKKYDLIGRLKLEQSKLSNFLALVESGYIKTNPYHNNLHAADVARNVHYFIVMGQFLPLNYLTDFDLLILIISSLIHDFNHPGRTNAFYIATKDEKALLYNDRSVLENYHVSQIFFLLFSPNNQCNFLENFSSEKFNYFRKTMIELILATDLSGNAEFIAKFRNWQNAQLAGPGTIATTAAATAVTIVTSTCTGGASVSGAGIAKSKPPMEYEDRLMIMKMSLKCADIGHATKCLRLHEKWTFRITEEFYRQGDEERKLGLSISPFMDRQKTNLSQAQVGFIDFVVTPLYATFFKFADPEDRKQRLLMEHQRVKQEKYTEITNLYYRPSNNSVDSHGSSEFVPPLIVEPIVVIDECTVMEQLKRNREHWKTWQGQMPELSPPPLHHSPKHNTCSGATDNNTGTTARCSPSPTHRSTSPNHGKFAFRTSPTNASASATGPAVSNTQHSPSHIQLPPLQPLRTSPSAHVRSISSPYYAHTTRSGILHSHPLPQFSPSAPASTAATASDTSSQSSPSPVPITEE